MKKPLLFLTFMVLILTLAGCGAPKPENVDAYRTKQLLSSYYGNLNEVLKMGEQKSDIHDIPSALKAMGDAAKVQRMILIMEGQSFTKSDLVNNPDIMRKLSFAWGEGDLKYHLKLPGDQRKWVTDTFSATTMTTYNLSYLVNLPAKLVANIRTDIFIWQEGNHYDKWGNVVLKGSVIAFIVQDLFYAIMGFILSIFMLPFGFIIGFLTSPIQTFKDIFPVIIGLFKTIYYAVRNLFY